MWRVVARAVIARDADCAYAWNWMRYARLELVLLDGPQRRQGAPDFGDKSRQARTRSEHVLDRWRDKEVVVGPEQHRSRRKAVRGIHSRAYVRLRDSEAVAIEAHTHVDGQGRRHLHLVLEEHTGLPASLLTSEDDRPWNADAEVRTTEVDVALVDIWKMRKVNPRLTEVVQVLVRP